MLIPYFGLATRNQLTIITWKIFDIMFSDEDRLMDYYFLEKKCGAVKNVKFSI